MWEEPPINAVPWHGIVCVTVHHWTHLVALKHWQTKGKEVGSKFLKRTSVLLSNRGFAVVTAQCGDDQGLSWSCCAVAVAVGSFQLRAVRLIVLLGHLCAATCDGVMGLMAPLQPVSLTQALPDFVLMDDVPLPSTMSSRLLSAVSWIF